jgi:regulator of nonsense transcripts 3
MAVIQNANGILSVPASVTSKKATTISTPSHVSPRSGLRRLRLIIRRLPPGLTQAEFEEILGDEWQLGAGRVDWFAYKNGKISKE